MSLLDRLLPLWILLAMITGLLLGRLIPGLDTFLDSMSVGGISLPIALGLLIMMYPPLAKVRYDKTKEIAGEVGQDLEAHRLGEHLEQQGVPCRVVVGKAPRRKGAAGGGGVGKHG